MITLADLHAMLNYAADQRKEISSRYGLISTASIGAIQRALLRLREEDGDKFFGEPALELQDLMRQDMAGNGIVSILRSEERRVGKECRAGGGRGQCRDDGVSMQ